jgi:hypothetical protein
MAWVMRKETLLESVPSIHRIDLYGTEKHISMNGVSQEILVTHLFE